MNFISLMAGMGGSTASGTASSSNPITFVLIMGVMVLFMYLTTIRPQKKKQKEEQEMRDNLQVGDEITTIGGICGRVVSVKDDAIVIETGSDRARIRVKRWAISSVDTVKDDAEA